MLYETVQGWYREAEAKGFSRGEAEGKADFLLKILELKFGPLEAGIRERVYRLDNAALEKCAERLLQAESLREVLGYADLH